MLLQLRVFYARDEPWTPILIIVVITAVKIVMSLLAPHATDDPDLVAGYLGTASGIGFLARGDPGLPATAPVTAPAGWPADRRHGGPDRRGHLGGGDPGGRRRRRVDHGLGLQEVLTVRGGGGGSLLRLLIPDGRDAADPGGGDAGRPGARRDGGLVCRSSGGWCANPPGDATGLTTATRGTSCHVP